MVGVSRNKKIRNEIAFHDYTQFRIQLELRLVSMSLTFHQKIALTYSMMHGIYQCINYTLFITGNMC